MSLRACTDSGFTWAEAPGMASTVTSTPSIRSLRIIVSLGLEVDQVPLRASHGSLEALRSRRRLRHAIYGERRCWAAVLDFGATWPPRVTHRRQRLLLAGGGLADTSPLTHRLMQARDGALGAGRFGGWRFLARCVVSSLASLPHVQLRHR